MKKLTLAAIREWGPCYDPAEKFAEWLDPKWKGTIVDLLKEERVPVEDRIWCAAHYMDDKQARLFAVWCAREALKLDKTPDPRSVNACDIAERFAHGKATPEELEAAREAAWAAAREAAWAASREAAWAASWAAARAASREAAWEGQVKKLIEMCESVLVAK